TAPCWRGSPLTTSRLPLLRAKLNSQVMSALSSRLASSHQITRPAATACSSDLTLKLATVVASSIPDSLSRATASKETWAWFEQMHDSVREEGIRFLAIGLVTNDSSTTSAILDWANALQNRVDYLVVKNKVAGEDFSYLFESEPGQRFLQLAKPAIIEMERRLPDIQQELNDRGLSLRQALEASAEIAGPVLSKSYNRIRIKGYVNRLEKQFSEVIDVLLPPYEAFAGK